MQTSERTPRLRRLDQLFVRTPLFFVTFCTAERKRILAHNEVHDAFVFFGHRALDHGVHVGRYVIMPDHLHFFAVFADSARPLALWIKSLKNSLSKILRTQNHAAPHWQKGFFDHVMRSAESYSEKWDYVSANPVRAGLVLEPGAWPYQGTINDLRF